MNPLKISQLEKERDRLSEEINAYYRKKEDEFWENEKQEQLEYVGKCFVLQHNPDRLRKTASTLYIKVLEVTGGLSAKCFVVSDSSIEIKDYDIFGTPIHRKYIPNRKEEYRLRKHSTRYAIAKDFMGISEEEFQNYYQGVIASFSEVIKPDEGYQNISIDRKDNGIL